MADAQRSCRRRKFVISGAPSNSESKPVSDRLESGMVLDDLEDQSLEFFMNVAALRLKAISASVQEQIDDQECGSLIPIRKAVVPDQGLGESRRLSVNRSILSGECPSDSGFKQTPITDTGQAAISKRLLVRFDEVLNSDAIMPYGRSALCQAFKGVRRARRGVPNACCRTSGRKRSGPCVPVNRRRATLGGFDNQRLLASCVAKDEAAAGRCLLDCRLFRHG